MPLRTLQLIPLASHSNNRLDGSSTGLTGNLSIVANGQTALFLSDIPGFAWLQTPFQGMLHLSSSSSISVIDLRGRYNERNDVLITTTPSINEAAAPSSSPVFFPYIADSGGYTTQFTLFNAQPRSLRDRQVCSLPCTAERNRMGSSTLSGLSLVLNRCSITSAAKLTVWLFPMIACSILK
jgi:hypothetical protein